MIENLTVPQLIAIGGNIVSAAFAFRAALKWASSAYVPLPKLPASWQPAGPVKFSELSQNSSAISEYLRHLKDALSRQSELGASGAKAAGIAAIVQVGVFLVSAFS